MARSTMWAATVTIGVVRPQGTAASAVVARPLAVATVLTALLSAASKINPELVEGLEFLFLFVVALGATTF